MNTERSDFDRALREWFSDGPTTMPDRVVDLLADRIDRQPQRHAWRLRGRPFMNSYAKVALAAAAVVILAVAGYSILPRTGPGPGGVPSPSPTVLPAATKTPIPSAAAYPCDDSAFRCAGILAAGSVSTSAFKPHLTFTIPDGWANSLDRERTFNLKPADGTMFFAIYSQVAIPNQNGACAAERKAGAGTTVADFVDFFTSHPGLITSTAEPIKVGGYDGMRVTVHVKPSWTARCPGSVAPAVVLLTDTVATPDRVIWVDDQYSTISIIDVAGTTVIARVESGPSDTAARFDQARMQPVIDSFQFTLGG